MKIHIQFLRSSGKALNVFIGRLCSKCTKQEDSATSKSQTTDGTCIHGLLAPSGKHELSAVPEVAGDDGNREVANVQLKEKPVLGFDPPRKPSARHRLKIWISTRHTGIIGRYGNKLDLGFFNGAKRSSAEHLNTGWPDWLVNVAPEAVQGWAPLRVDLFERLSKVHYQFDGTSYFIRKKLILFLVSISSSSSQFPCFAFVLLSCRLDKGHIVVFTKLGILEQPKLLRSRRFGLSILILKVCALWLEKYVFFGNSIIPML